MLTTPRHRAVLTVSLLLCGALLWPLPVLLRPFDGSSGLTLWSAGSGGMILAWGLILLAAAVGGVATALAHPMTGLVSLSGALTLAAARGGSGSGWLDRSALPGGFGWLAIEMVLWLLLGVGCIALMVKMARRWGPQTDDSTLVRPQVSDLPAIGIVLAVGGALSWWLLRSHDGGQVIGGLLVGFAIAGVVARATRPEGSVTALLAAPALAATLVYLWVSVKMPGDEATRLAVFNMNGAAAQRPRLAGLALALPMQVISAGSLGVLLGHLWAPSLLGLAVERELEQEETAEPTSSG